MAIIVILIFMTANKFHDCQLPKAEAQLGIIPLGIGEGRGTKTVPKFHSSLSNLLCILFRVEMESCRAVILAQPLLNPFPFYDCHRPVASAEFRVTSCQFPGLISGVDLFVNLYCTGFFSCLSVAFYGIFSICFATTKNHI